MTSDILAKTHLVGSGWEEPVCDFGYCQFNILAEALGSVAPNSQLCGTDK